MKNRAFIAFSLKCPKARFFSKRPTRPASKNSWIQYVTDMSCASFFQRSSFELTATPNTINEQGIMLLLKSKKMHEVQHGIAWNQLERVGILFGMWHSGIRRLSQCMDKTVFRFPSSAFLQHMLYGLRPNKQICRIKTSSPCFLSTDQNKS